ncbi:MAG TPA: hypothetical protein VJ717_03525 [Gemmatimonadaceae bacterium]|nr:hypothetical protein [Gemmatimonadaceae bacterium]
MRFTRILGLATAALLVSATATSAAPNTSSVPSVSAMTIAPAPFAMTVVQQTAQPQTEVKVDLDTNDDRVWFTDPVWLAVGAIALLVVIVLAVMASRGGSNGGTTVVR